MKDIFKNIILDFHKQKEIKFIKRDLAVPLNTNKIVTIIGVRRSGKTYYLYQIITEILKKVKKENIIYINFEDERISEDSENLQLLMTLLHR